MIHEVRGLTLTDRRRRLRRRFQIFIFILASIANLTPIKKFLCFRFLFDFMASEIYIFLIRYRAFAKWYSFLDMRSSRMRIYIYDIHEFFCPFRHFYLRNCVVGHVEGFGYGRRLGYSVFSNERQISSR